MTIPTLPYSRLYQTLEQEGTASPRHTYFCGSFTIKDDTTLVADILKVTDRLDIKLPKSGRVPEFRIWTEADCWLVTGSRDQFALPLKLVAMKTRKIKAPQGKFGIVEHPNGQPNTPQPSPPYWSTPSGEMVYTVRRYREEREGSIDIR